VAGPSGAICGELTSAGAAVALSVDGNVVPVPKDADITLVDSCPKK
jgi:hypothetical protein